MKTSWPVLLATLLASCSKEPATSAPSASAARISIDAARPLPGWLFKCPHFVPALAACFRTSADLRSARRTLTSETFLRSVFNALPVQDIRGLDTRADSPALAPAVKEGIFEEFAHAVEITPIQRTRLLDVRFRHRNGRVAAEMANRISDSFIGTMPNRMRIIARAEPAK